MLPALIIVFREGFESFLIVAIIFAFLRKTGRDALRPAVWAAIAFSVVASIAMGYALQSLQSPLWEGILALVAAVLVGTFVVHVWRTAPKMKQEMETQLEARVTKGAWLGVFGFTALMITREGMETALMLIQVRQGRFWLGCFLGLALAAGMSWLWAHFGHRVNVKRFFQVTSLFLLLFAVQIVFYGIHELSEAEVLPNSHAIHTATEPYSADGRYGLHVLGAMLGICAIFLIATTIYDRMKSRESYAAV